jgi:hypothetical protein
MCSKYSKILVKGYQTKSAPIFKKGTSNMVDNYCRIILLNSGHKIYRKTINYRIETIIEALLLQNQNGFRQECSCANIIFTIK